MTIETLIQKMLAGNQRALSQLLSTVERQDTATAEVLRAIHPHTGRAYTVGFTGPPGGGKSTLVDQLSKLLRADAKTMGIIAVDPTSPFSGGALLGDRIRMQQHYLDKGVFIRSAATRGSLGGLPAAASSMVKLLDAAGKDFVLVETVGVGQTELDIMEVADTVVVVLVPESGDSIQTLKAGILEIADIFVVNKADRPGADALVKEVQFMQSLGPGARGDGGPVPVLSTQAHTGVGVDKLYGAIQEHRQAQQASGRLEERRRRRRREEFLRAIRGSLFARLEAMVRRDGHLRSYLAQVEEGREDSYAAAQRALGDRRLLQSWLSSIREE